MLIGRCLIFHSFLLLLFMLSQQRCPFMDLNVLYRGAALRSQQQQGKRPRMGRELADHREGNNQISQVCMCSGGLRTPALSS